MVRYADDFVVLCWKGHGAEMYRRLKKWLEKRGLKLNEEKTRIVDFTRESFEFLGFRLSWRKGVTRSKRWYPCTEASPKSCAKLREAVKAETGRDTYWKEIGEVVRRINQRIRGWISYFHYWNSTETFARMRWTIENRLRRWLWKKHGKSRGEYSEAYSRNALYERYGLIRFPTKASWTSS